MNDFPTFLIFVFVVWQVLQLLPRTHREQYRHIESDTAAGNPWLAHRMLPSRTGNWSLEPRGYIQL